MKNPQHRTLLSSLLFGALCSAGATALAATGAERFAHDCASCHGASARGDGAQGLELDPRPANLRSLAARNGGQFPADKLRRIIDGREQSRAHGDGKMPVWGHEYSRALAGQGERMVQQNLDNLVEFLETIQE